DQAFAPPGGWGPRWLVQPVGDQSRAKEAPAGPEILQGSSIVLDAAGADTPALGLTFRNWNLDANAEEHFTDWLSYNGAKSIGRPEAVHDFAVRFDLEVRSGDGSFACRLSDGLDSVFIEMPIGRGAPEGTLLGQTNGEAPLANPLRLAVGKTYRVEFFFF